MSVTAVRVSCSDSDTAVTVTPGTTASVESCAAQRAGLPTLGCGLGSGHEDQCQAQAGIYARLSGDALRRLMLLGLLGVWEGRLALRCCFPRRCLHIDD